MWHYMGPGNGYDSAQLGGCGVCLESSSDLLFAERIPCPTALCNIGMVGSRVCTGSEDNRPTLS